ncbi:hypothetical protein [Rubellicoccus peritrichatus]|uniref:DoxX family membrane protein n=1 Tax=Rubellicoccus peritrichatus TaxID=3080537 RepID=A0AAQ3LBR9_9BACT|nr:hypothetical protein [Puniceicoccus sp. CR14]WOO42402.1 hypothetical protein RZN69_04820 [Puniceicoccus sp. CR14]
MYNKTTFVLNKIDEAIIGVLQKYGVLLLRLSLAVIFMWFGLLKVFGVSPAEELVKNTVYWLPPDVFLPILGYWEALIGFFLLWRPLIRVSLLLLLLQMPGTALPLLLLPHVCFTQPPFGLTMEGQYIIKNLVLISAAIVVGGTARLHSSNKSFL